jgi:drug/metabolite transporter (DMT)-like permease
MGLSRGRCTTGERRENKLIGPEALAITYGLSSAITWGAGDFSAGFASRKSGVVSVVLFSQLIGAGFLFFLAMFFSGSLPSLRDMAFGGLAGVFGVLGLMALYQGLSLGRMGIVAPLSAIVTAMIPIGFAFFKEGLPNVPQIIGLALALVSVWLLSFSKNKEKRYRFTEFTLPLLSGIGFGLFFILIDAATQESLLWPLVGTRCVSLLMMSILFLASSNAQVPKRNQLPFIALAGICDIMGNLFFALATNLGRLDISAMLSSLFPAATVTLAWFFLKEKLNRYQWLGVAVALVALILISA